MVEVAKANPGQRKGGVEGRATTKEENITTNRKFVKVKKIKIKIKN
jgi:hypothetical protein